MKIMVSACLAGENCKYDGGSNQNTKVLELMEGNEVITVCPEQLGGLSTPRPPSEIRQGRVINRMGQDVTAQYQKGAEEALRLCRLLHCDAAILKARSPSCGCGQVYDGSFSGALVPDDGVTARLLRENGIKVFTEESISNMKGSSGGGL